MSHHMSDQQPQSPTVRPDPNQQSLKLIIDLAPLLVFFAAYMTLGIFWATGVLMVATVASMIASKMWLGHISPALILSTGLVVGFGALTLWFNDPRFIKMKPTIIYAMFALALFLGYMLGKPFLKYLLGEALRLTDTGWQVLSVRWACFFVLLAVFNEIVWRNFSETTWATFKVFGFLPLTMIFFALQLSLIQRHQLPEPSTEPHSDH
jgi:intracellular septation protein